jgi:hypothetical protein
MDNLGLVEAIDGFREGIVVTIANTADRRLNACFRQALGVLDREVLGCPGYLSPMEFERQAGLA